MSGTRPRYRIEEHIEGALFLALGKELLDHRDPLGTAERRRDMGELRRRAEEHAGHELDWHRAMGQDMTSPTTGGCVVVWAAPSFDTYITQEEVA